MLTNILRVFVKDLKEKVLCWKKTLFIFLKSSFLIKKFILKSWLHVFQ